MKNKKYIVPRYDQDLALKMAERMEFEFLNSVISYLMTENKYVTTSSLKKIANYFEMFNLNMFNSDREIQLRIYIIQRLIRFRVNKKIKNREILIANVPGEGDFKEEVLEYFDYNLNELSSNDIEVVDESICDKIKWAKLLAMIPDLRTMIMDLEEDNFSNLGSFIEDVVEPLLTTAHQEMKNIRKFEKTTSKDFNLERESFLSIIEETSELRNSPAANIRTGLQALNSMLGGKGFESTRVYIMLGVSNRWKSGFLLNVIFWFVRYNQQITTLDPTKKPCALYLTLENDIYETLERTVSSEANDESNLKDSLFLRKKPEELFQEMFDNGFNDKNVNVFFKYRYTRSIDSYDVAGMIDELYDEGWEVRLVTIDYIARMNSINKESEERFRIASIVDQLSAHVAKEKHVPVVSASQLNRQAQIKIEEAITNGESNIAFKMGNSMVAEAYGLIQNADFVMIGDKEKNYDEQGNRQDYYVIKNSKLRGRDTGAVNKFVQPFKLNNGMRLVEDESIDIDGIKPKCRAIDKLADIAEYNAKPSREIINKNRKPPLRKNRVNNNDEKVFEKKVITTNIKEKIKKKKPIIKPKFKSTNNKRKVLKDLPARPRSIEPPQ